MNVKFGIAAMLAAVMLLVAADAQAQYRSRPRPVPAQRHAAIPRAYNSGSSDDDMCYKGFIEAGYSAGVGNYRANQLDVLTTHGVAIGDGFVGVGTGVNVLFPKEEGVGTNWSMGDYGNGYRPQGANYRSENAVFIPLYLDLKYNFSGSSVSPFVDLKLGGTFLVNDNAVCLGNGWIDNRTSVYCSPSVGVRIPIGGSAAFNMAVTYTLISQKYYYYDYWDGPVYSDGISLHSLGARLSIEW